MVLQKRIVNYLIKKINFQHYLQLKRQRIKINIIQSLNF